MTTATPTATSIPTGKWSTDPIHSSVGFETTHMVVSKFRGSFSDFDVTLDTTGEKPRLSGNVRVASVETRLEDLTQHLQTADFFDAANYPEISFSSDAVEIDENGRVTAEGELTMRGVTKPVTVTGEYRYVPQTLAGVPAIGLDLEAVVNRHDYGISWNAPLPGGGFALADDVKLTTLIELVPAEEN